MKPLNILTLVVVIIVIIWVCYSIRNRDYYGQDPSIRASVGWIAGPNYGYDPITHFAEQIAEMRRKIHAQCHSVCRNRNTPECHRCVREAQA